VLYDRADSAFALAAASRYDWRALLAGARWLHVSGITPAVSRQAADAALAAMTFARDAGINVSFDCNYRARLWADREAEAPALLSRLCACADLIFGNERDFQLLLDSPPAAAIGAAFETFPALQWIAGTDRSLQSADAHQLVGSLRSRTQLWRSRAHALRGIVDRIGAGDAFAAGVLHGLLTQMTPQQTVEFAAAAGCLKHTIPGDFNLATLDDIERLLAADGMDVRR